MRRVLGPLAASLVAAALLAACGAVPAATPGAGESGGPTRSDVPVSTTAATEGGDGSDLPDDFPVGAGDYVLLDPVAGLAALDGHASRLTETFEGTAAGAPAAWSRTVTFSTTTNPDARQATVVRTGTDPATQAETPGEPATTIEAGGLHHELDAAGSCATSDADPAAPLSDPAAALGPLVGATAAGSELVGDVATNVYTIDRGALGIMAEVDVTGRAWIAATGEYIVKYELDVSGGPKYFGEGISGTIRIRYELTAAGDGPISVPAGCRSLAITIAMPADATDVTDAPGYLGYRTGASVADAAGLVRATALIAHWAPIGTDVIDETTAHLEYEVEGYQVDVFVTSLDDGSAVQMVASPPEP